MELGGAALAQTARDKEVAAAQQVLEAIPENLLETRLYSQAEASKVLGIDVKTLKSARDRREAMGTKLNNISPLDLASIHFQEVNGVYSYPAIELRNFLKRIKFARKLSIAAQGDSKRYEESIRPTTLLAFQTWLYSAPVTETWPFCIQPNGRPLDLVAALVLGLTSADIRWLTVQEFSKLAADAARIAYTREEGVAIESGTLDPKVLQDESEEEVRKKRWTKPGGPM